MKKILLLFFLSVLSSSSLWAQDSGSQDSTGVSKGLRPRRDTYIIEPFPSPAMHGVTMDIQIYNQNPQQVRVLIVDINDKIIKELQAPATLENGIHHYPFNTSSVSNGSYHVRLITYTSTGAEDVTQDAKFIVVH